MRATDTGFSMSMGRLGAVVRPSLAGWLMSAGFSREVYFAAMAVPMLLAVACLYRLRALDLPAAAPAGEPAVSSA
jgi:hypothetical protein